MNGRDPLGVSAAELWSLTALTCVYLAASLVGEPGGVIDLAGPLWLAITLMAAATRAVLRAPAALWTGLFWLRLSSAVYFGLGTAADRVMNETSRTAILDFFEASDAEIASFNLITATSILAVLATIKAANALWPAPLRHSVPADDRMMLWAALIFGVPGYAAKYLLVFPHAMGAFGDITIPGLVGQAVWLAPVSIFLMLVWAQRNARHLVPLVIGFILLDSFGGVLRFSKGDALLPLLMLAIGLLQHRVSLTRLAFCACIAVAGFSALQSSVAYGRGELIERHGTIRLAPFGERLSILSDYLRDGPQPRHTELQGGLIRIAYVHAAAPAIAMRDAGEAGTSLAWLPYLFVPRLLWPDKPVFDVTTEYTAAITGSDTSSTWMGYYVEAYWNLGWLGLPLVMVPLGLILWATGRYALWAQANHRWLHFPAVFLGMYMGARSDGILAGDVAASALTIAALYPLARLGEVLLADNPSLRGNAPA